MDNNVKYFIDRVENNDRSKMGVAFFMTAFFQVLILFPVLFAMYFAAGSIIILILMIAFLVVEISYIILISSFYSKNRFIKPRAVTCYADGQIVIECRKGYKKLTRQDIEKISYTRFWVPFSYIMHNQEGSPHYSRYFTPFMKLSDEGILKIKTKDFIYRIYVVNNLKAKIDHLNKFVLKEKSS